MPKQAGGGKVEMNEYQHWEHGILEDVSHDTDAIIKMLGGKEKMESFDSGLLTGMLSKQGVDPSIIALLDRDRNNGMLGDNGLVLLFLILLLGGRNGFGFGGNGVDGMGVAGVDRTVVNEANYSRLLDAVAGNREAISGLAQTLNCDTDAIQSALCGLDKQLALSQGSITSAIQSCCCTLQSKIDECCCRTNLNIERMSNGIEKGLQENRFLISNQFSAQTQLMQQLACDNRSYLAEQFCQIKEREDAREIQNLRDKLENAKADARMVAILSAINGKDTVSGTLNTTAGTWEGTVS